MTNTKDLNIEDEILPLFDFTFNLFSGQAVRDILKEPLGSEKDILFRQHILKGFAGNNEVLKEYSFNRFNLSEIYDFFETFAAGSFTGNKLRRKLLFSEKERSQKRGRLILLILLFNNIHTNYVSKLNTKLFPAEYAAELDALNRFFSDFNLAHYQAFYNRKNKIRVGQIVELIAIIVEKINNGEAAAFWKRWFLFEAYLSINRGIARHGFVFPVFDDQVFSIKGLYHPLLKKPVSNDLTAHKNTILITGPNMSGKSTFLKAVSLCVYLGHIGLAVPAAAATLPFYSCISVSINLTDSIVSGYSHFMSEIITLKNVVEAARKGERCFAVFDELFRGTNIEDALEISTATIKGLVRFPQSLFLVSTHLHQLHDLDAIKNGTVATSYIECNLQDNIPSFTYRLKDGWSDLRLGRILFEKEGLTGMLSG